MCCRSLHRQKVSLDESPFSIVPHSCENLALLPFTTPEEYRERRSSDVPPSTAILEAMRKYYFHVYDGDRLDRDYAGMDLANIHEARTEAVNVARELCHLWDDLPPGALNRMSIEVADEAGQTVLVVPFPTATGQVG
jgi:hypothetical protein